MMPTSPPSPLKFRTVGFPQYGFKASRSDPACPARPELKLAPGIRSGPRWFAMALRPCAGYLTLVAPVPSPTGQSGVVFPHGRAADPRGPWLRSELCCLRPSSLTPTPSASLAGTARLHRVTAYTRGLRCAGAPRRPARPSRLSLPVCPHVPRTLRRWGRRQLPLCPDGGTRLPRVRRGSPPTVLASASHTRRVFVTTRHPSLHAAARAFAQPSGLAPTGEASLPRLLRYRVPPALGAGRHRPPLGGRLDGRTGNLPSPGLPPG